MQLQKKITEEIKSFLKPNIPVRDNLEFTEFTFTEFLFIQICDCLAVRMGNVK